MDEVSLVFKHSRCSEPLRPDGNPVLNDQAGICKPALLTAAAIVCYSGPAELAGLAHVAQSISGYLDTVPDLWTLESLLHKNASTLDEAHLPRVLDRLLALEWTGLGAEFRLDRFVHNVNEAGNCNKLQVVDWWLTKYLLLTPATSKKIMERAVNWDRIHVLEWLEQKGALPDPKNLRVECRHADTTFWLHERGFKLSIDVEIEITLNNLEFIKWVDAHKAVHVLRDLEKGIILAARNNRVEMAKLLTEAFTENEWCELDAMRDLVLDLSMVQWLETEFFWDDRGRYGEHFGLLADWHVFLKDSDSSHYIWLNHTIAIAAKNGQLDVVQYLYDNIRHEPKCELTNLAAEHGHMDVVQWLHSQPSLGCLLLSLRKHFGSCASQAGIHKLDVRCVRVCIGGDFPLFLGEPFPWEQRVTQRAGQTAPSSHATAVADHRLDLQLLLVATSVSGNLFLVRIPGTQFFACCAWELLSQHLVVDHNGVFSQTGRQAEQK